MNKPIEKSTEGEATPQKSIMKWVGIAIAVLSLVAGVRQFISLTAESAERDRRFTEALKIGAAQQTARDYPQAWSSFDAALTQAEQGNFLAKLTGRLGEQREQVRAAQEDLAMRWLENISVPEGKTFSSIVDPLMPVLHRGAVVATGPRGGDLYAHIGWGYFLKWRDGQTTLDPEPWYAMALQADPGNPYAHAYSAHWQVWNNKSLDDAMREFDAALAGNRERPFVRSVQVTALINRQSDDARVHLVKMVDDMRKHGEPVDARAARELRYAYSFALRDEALVGRLVAAVPIPDHLATIKVVQDASPPDVSFVAMTAVLQEAAGQQGEAMESWRAVRAMLPEKSYTALAKRADAALKR